MATSENDLSGKVGLDTTDFKTGIKDLDRQVRVAESGFRSVAASMVDWATNQEGLQAKTKSLTTVVDLQKQKVANLTTEYKRISAELGESSSAAQGLLIKLNNATTTLNKNELELEQNKTALENFGKELTTTATKADLAKEKIEGFTKNLSNIGTKATSAGTAMLPLTVGIVAAGAASIKLGSDYTESLNKVDVAFKGNSQTVKDWSKTTLDSFGIAGGTALDMSSLFGDMATSMGISTSKAADMSMNLTGLAGDLASFKNISLEVAKTGLNGIFTGETESLKQLGIVMTEVNLKEFARKQGISKSIDAMTEAEKVQLRYNYVLDKTKNAQGDFARTSDGTANSLRIMQESTKELGVAFSGQLLPAITPVVQGATKLIKSFSELDDGQKKTIVTVGLLAAGIAPVLIVVGKMATGISAVTTAFTTIKAAILAKTAVTTIDTAATAANTAVAGVNAATTGANAVSKGGLAVANGTATVTTVSLTAAQTACNVAMSANPIGLVIGAIALLATGVTALIGVMQPEKENLDAITESVNKQSESWKNLKQSSSDNIALSTEQGNKAGELADKLDKLVTANGKVKGSKDEVKKVMAELNQIYPNTVWWIDNETVGYDKTNKSLKNLIETKRAQAILDAAQPAYNEAIANTTKVQNEQAEIALKITEKELEQKEKQSVWNLKSQGEAKQLGKDIEELHEDYAKGEKTLKGYYDVVNKNAELSGAIATNNTAKIKEYTSGTIDMFGESATTTAEYSDKIKSLAMTYLTLKEKFDKGTDGVTQSMVDNAKNNLDSNYKSWQKVGAYSADGYLIGFKSSNAKNLAGVEAEMQKIIDKANQKLKIKSPSRVFVKIGDYTGQGFNLGFTSSMKTALQNAESTINTGISGLNAQTVNSPTFSGSSSTGNKSSQSAGITTITNHNRYEMNIKADEIQEVSNLVRVLDSFEQINNAGEVDI